MQFDILDIKRTSVSAGHITMFQIWIIKKFTEKIGEFLLAMETPVLIQHKLYKPNLA
jgi:hypothetical protein